MFILLIESHLLSSFSGNGGVASDSMKAEILAIITAIHNLAYKH